MLPALWREPADRHALYPGLAPGFRAAGAERWKKVVKMTFVTTRVAPMNSLVFLSAPEGGEPPEPVRGAMVLATSSCISVGCYPEIDGPTEIVLGDVAEVDPGWPAEFTGDLSTSSRTVIVSDVMGDTLLRRDVPGDVTRITVWLSHPEWPEKVVIGLG